MTTLSKTSTENLENMVANGGYVENFKGQGRMMEKMISDGLVTKHIWGGRYVWQITSKGRNVVNIK